MSRAFVKEDVEIPERAVRTRSASGLPPGAVNYMTGRGARLLRERMAELRVTGDKEKSAELEAVLASATVVERPDVSPESVAFGAAVTVSGMDGKQETYRIVGVDEVDLEEGCVSWISPTGRTLLSAELGDKVMLEDQTVTIVKIEHGD